MKIYIFIAFLALFAIASGVFVPPRHGHRSLRLQTLNSKECTLGSSYWCQNITTAAGCKAVQHCIQTVWIYQKLPADTSSVCQTCLDMVKEARDQLMSNETQEMIKQVFEGSCALLRVKPIVQECDKIADQFIPELIDTLSSEMNPQVVCAVAGLCNNERVHKLLEEARESVESSGKADVAKMDSCQGCHAVVDLLESKFSSMSRDDILQAFLGACGRLSTFSDGCSNIIISYFSEIYNHLAHNLKSDEVCLMSGECSSMFHKHANVEITPMSHVGYVQVGKDDLPCELCEQLVTHLKELLIANTTEDEFKMVLQGLCNQTRSFSQECLSIVDQYYSVFYDFLVHELNSTVLCDMIGICKNDKYQKTPIAPLVPVQTAELHKQSSKKFLRVGLAQEESVVRIEPPPQLPIELLVPPHVQALYNSNNNEVCLFCQYFLHFIQQEITDPKTEAKIERIINDACSKLPDSINSTCVAFVETYEPALVAILAQEIDPSIVCPEIHACAQQSENKDIEIFMQAKGDSKCPLCLFAVSKLESMVKDKKTQKDIEKYLDKLCDELPSAGLKQECDDFVQTYSKELVEMLIADLKPEEVCVYLKCCSDSRPPKPITVPANQERNQFVSDLIGSGDVETNIIQDNTVNGIIIDTSASAVSRSPKCVICEFVMNEIEQQLKNNKTDEEIKEIVLHVCNAMPGTVRKQCDDFLEQYGNTIIELLIQVLVPDQICPMMDFCLDTNMANMQVEILECPICILIVEAMEKILKNPSVDHDIEHVLEKSCRALPHRYRKKCKDVVDKYGPEIFNLVIHHQVAHVVCSKISLCLGMQGLQPRRDVLVGTNPCTYGPAYWCESEQNSNKCGAKKHCMEKVWFGSSPPKN